MSADPVIQADSAMERARGRAPSRPSARSITALVVGGIATAVLVRLALMPFGGLEGDLEEFFGWIGAIATDGLGSAYGLDLSFPPVMVYVFAALGAIEPGFVSAADASDPWLRTVMKVPAVVADFAIAGVVAILLRDRPRWAIAAALGVLLVPAVWYASAWWGQFESIYVLFGLGAAILAISDRHRAAVVVLAVAVMTKPQALPFLVPFGAYWLGSLGWRRSVELGLIGVVTMVALWLPFVASGGPADYLESLRRYQDDVYAVLSLRAWNAWWPLQQAAVGSDFLSDRGALLGPVTPRLVGLVATAVGMILVARSVYRRPTRETLLLGLAAAVLVAFTFLTTMHERYVFGAIVFLAPLLPDRRVLVLWLVVATIASLNFVAAAPPTQAIGDFVPISGPIAVVASIATLGSTVASLLLLARWSTPPEDATETPAHGDEVPAQVAG